MKYTTFGDVGRAVTFIFICTVAPNGIAQSSSDVTTMRDVKKEVADVTESIKKYSADRKDEAVDKAQAALDELDASIKSLERSIEKRSEHMSQATRDKARQTLEDLRAQRNRVAEWYGGLKHSSRDAWDHVKEGFSESYSALRSAWDEARKEFDHDGLGRRCDIHYRDGNFVIGARGNKRRVRDWRYAASAARSAWIGLSMRSPMARSSCLPMI